MEKERSDNLIAGAAKTIFSYCRARTNSKENAEDLSQDIILELLRMQENLRDDKAFYGFMWAIAGNIYKEWCKKRKKTIESELEEILSDDSVPLVELLEKESNLSLLYRELCLLTEQYRKVIIMYYFNDVKVSDISKSLNISESMVKFLLFKSRKILKEGMNMERKKGDLGFNPGHINLAFLRDERSNAKPEDGLSFWTLVNDSLIAQNILLACYNDRCTAEEISLQIGVAVPYIERDLKKLCEKDLLIQKGGKYETAIVILTKEFSEESYEKTLPAQREISEIIDKFLNEYLNDIKAIGFYRGVEDDNLLKWLITQIIFRESCAKYYKSLNSAPLKKYAGIEAVIFGVEPWSNKSGNMANTEHNNAIRDLICCAHFLISGAKAYSSYFVNYQNRVNIILDIAKGKNTGFSENDMSEIAELIKHGIIRKNGDELSLMLPVFTKEQFDKFKNVVEDVITVISDKMCDVVNTTTDILIQHTPVLMKKETKNISWVKSRDCAAVSIKIMMDKGILQRVTDNAHPTTFVVLA